MYNIENYENFGFATPFSLGTKFERTDYLSEYFDFQNKCKKNLGTTVTIKPNLLSHFFDSIVFDEEIISRVNRLIGPDVYVWSSALFTKAPGEGKVVSFHQDNPYWQLTSTDVVTAWVALTDSNKESGGMQIVPGSHKFGVINELDVQNPRKAYLQGKKTTPKNDLLSYNQNLEDFVDRSKIVSIDLSPGMFSLHHIDAVHGSGVNKTNNHRIGYAIRYVSSNTKHKMETSDSALHISGRTNAYFDAEFRPNEDFDKEAIRCYKKGMLTSGAFGNKKYG